MSVKSLASGGQISYIINLEPNYVTNGQKFEDENTEICQKPYTSLIGIETSNEEQAICLNLSYWRFEKGEESKSGPATFSQSIPIATAIKSFLQNGGEIIQIIDLDSNISSSLSPLKGQLDMLKKVVKSD